MRQHQNKQPTHYYRFKDLERAKIVPNRVTLSRWIKAGRFPAPVQQGLNSIAWIAEEVDARVPGKIRGGYLSDFSDDTLVIMGENIAEHMEEEAS